MEIKFEEKQRFTQWWLWTLLLGITLIPAYGIYKQIILGEQFGDNPLPNFGLIIFLLSMVVFVGFFWKMELRTNIDSEGIRIKFFPFTNKEIKWEEIAQAKIVNYGFVGGWGVRLGTKYGTVYNTSGKIGLALVLRNGKRICIGTQREEKLNILIEEASRQQKL
jgi:hypothetical protein